MQWPNEPWPLPALCYLYPGMKYFMIAGEASGDLHGSNLVRGIKQLDKGCTVQCWGGEEMAFAGALVLKHYRELAFMGFVEVVKNLPAILRKLKQCKADILAYKPDVLVLIDYPGFNLRIAKWAKEQGIRVVYYISPQVWAWKAGRVETIRKVVDLMLVILPFEEAFYRQRDYKVTYVGHPLTEVVDAFREEGKLVPLSDKPIVAVLPGSRKQEVATKLPIMLTAADQFPEYQFIVAKAPSLNDAFYAPFLEGRANIAAVRGQTYALLSQAEAALVTSGTATLETALFRVPQVVCYKGSPISYAIAKRLVKIKYISLVNLIMDRPVVKELIQGALTPQSVKEELSRLLDDKVRNKMKADYDALYDLLKKGGSASQQAAMAIMAHVQANPVKRASQQE